MTEYIARPRVERRLRDAVTQTPLTLLRAPLGAGKSVAAAMAFADAPGVAWMDARPWHRGAFARSLVDAVRGVRDDFGRLTLGAADAGASDAHLGGTFARELSHVDDPLLLIVDNAQVFSGDPGFERFLDAVVSALPANARVLLLGRSLPDVAPRLFARELAVAENGAMLAFDTGEIRAMAALFERAIDDAAADAIVEATKGWAAGVALAVMGENTPASSPHEPRSLEDYASAGEIGAALFHAEAAHDATVSATFLRAHAEAAVATGDRARVRAMAAVVDPDGPDADVRWYADALLEKARGSAEAREKFARAAAAAPDGGAIAFQARAQMLEYDIGHGESVSQSALDDLARLASDLGTREKTTERTLRGWSRAVAHDFRGALAAIAERDEPDDPNLRFNGDILRAYALTAMGAADEAEDTLDALVAFLENDDRVVLQTLALIWFARLALVWGKTDAAADAAAQAARLAAALDLRAEEAALYAALAEVATHAGDAAGAARHAERARGRADRAWYAADVGRVRAFAEIALARAAFLSGDAAVAWKLAQDAAARADAPRSQSAIALAEAAAYAGLCEMEDTASQTDRARDALSRAIPLDAADAAALASAADLVAFLDASTGRVTRARGEGAGAFAALVGYRRGLVTLEYAGMALRAGGEAFETALDVLTRDGPRFETRVARAYAAKSAEMPHRLPSTAVACDLTPRETEILRLLVEGLTNKELAQRLVVSPRTVETHVERILGKLEVASRSRAIAKALRLGLVRL